MEQELCDLCWSVRRLRLKKLKSQVTSIATTFDNRLQLLLTNIKLSINNVDTMQERGSKTVQKGY